MSFTGLRYLETVLIQEWEEDIPGRIEPVPEPQIAIAGEGQTRLDPQLGDVVEIRDGGSQSITPRSMGWRHRRTESLVSIEVKTMKSRGRLEGFRTEANEPERYGGLRGEIQRILDTVRRGDKEFDWINGHEWNDLTEDVGFAHYKGVWEVRLTEHAQEIDPEP